ncbi:hypothetical protein QYF36_009146 [Acer negundo]|nr:hypothetical protein QYF36_009146 [Acer negundo]
MTDYSGNSISNVDTSGEVTTSNTAWVEVKTRDIGLEVSKGDGDPIKGKKSGEALEEDEESIKKKGKVSVVTEVSAVVDHRSSRDVVLISSTEIKDEKCMEIRTCGLVT